MPRCEDYPCCGHLPRECPIFNEEGKELCWDCSQNPIVKYGRCEKCIHKWQRKQKEFDYDLTGQDEELYND